ncbi:polysaccharide biosynthesis protein [Cryobacterium sp. TMT2-18-3]|nr:polysaccharide biosynthesis protein [Cryobacterium sp. TMT2-18-2]TFC66770.1 polysaccharide biosynthesis protein [Cryobacterium sp. TMT2-18-3]
MNAVERIDKPILIVGHGTAGKALARNIAKRGGSVAGYLDDASSAPEVLGRLSDINSVIAERQIAIVYFAIPSVGSKTVRDFVNSIETDDVEIAIVPRTYSILTRETVDIEDLTDIDVLDLVGREPVKQDLVSSARFLEGKRVLITGAAGSIGSQLVRQIAGMNSEAIACVDWWENGIFFLGQGLQGNEKVSYHIADIKNERLLERIIREFRPDIIFHAAAYKHVPLMQANPLEAINNNVGGTLTLMRLAIEHAVPNFVYVSTDKAVNPVNVMGATKRLGEMIMETLAGGSHSTTFNAVRFGNVIQSNGSVMQTFRSQISKKAPLTVTHPDVTRFFMTIDEASQLIIQSAMIGRDSDIFVLDMGEPVKILDLAQSLVKAVDPTLTIEITGLRPGEKMFEELSYEPSNVGTTRNPKIFVVRDARDFDESAFMESVEALLEQTSAYSVTPPQAVAMLKQLGFALQ